MQVPSTSLSKSNPLSNLAFDELLALADAAWAHSNAFLPGNDEGKTDQYPSILTSNYCMDGTLTNPTNKLLSHRHLSSVEQHPIVYEHDNPQEMQVPSTSLSKSNPLSNLAFDELLALADAAWAHSNAFLPGNDEGKTDQYPSILTSNYCMDGTLTNPTNKLLSHRHLSSVEQHPIVYEHDNPQEMQVPSTSLSKSNPLSNLAFDELLALADAAWAHSNAFLPGNDEGKTDQYPSILTSKSYCMDGTLTNPTNKLLSHRHLSSVEQHPIVYEHDNPQGTSCTTCCSITTSQAAPPIPDNGIRAERRPAEAMQMNMKEKCQGKKMIKASAIRIDNNGTPLSKEAQPKRTEKPVSPKPAQSNNDQTKKMMPESAKSCCNRSLNFDEGASDESSADKENATVHLGIDIGVIAPEMNAGIACELNSSMKQASNYTSFPNDKQAPGTSSESNLPGEKPKVIPAAKRKCVRRKGLNKNSTPPTEMTEEFTEELPEYAKMSCRRSLNPDIGARDESSAGRENGVMVQETNLGLAYDLNASVKHASNSFMSLPGGTQAPDISSQRTRPGTKPKENPTGKRKYVRRKELKKTSAPPTEVTGKMTTEKMPKFAKPPCKSSMNFDKGEIEESSAVKENATIHLIKEIVVTQEMNPDLAYDLNSCMSLTEDTQATNTSSRRNPHGAKPKESSTSERKYVRRSALNKSSTPTEVLGDLTGEMMPESAKTSCRRSLNFDKGARDESSADSENATVHLCKEIGLVMQEMDVGFAYDINTSMKQAAANNYMPFPNEQTPSTSPSKNNPPGAKPKENLAGKQEFKEMSRRSSSNSDIGIKDESSACREISDVQIANVVEETPVSLAYDQDTWLEQALNSYMSLPEETQSPSTNPSKINLPGAKPKERPTGKRKYVRKKKSNSTATPTETTGELTEPIMSDSSTLISCGMSLNFDEGGIDESNTCRESLACDHNTSVKEALYNYMSLSESTHAPSTSLPQSNPPGAKLNANFVENKNKRKGLATAQDGNISNSQISTTGLQMVGYKRKQSGTIKCAYNSSINLIGAHYNGSPSYESKFQIQFPNIQKKRRTEMRKTSNTHITSSVTSKKEVPLTCTQEVAQAHPYASKSNCWMYGSSAYNSAIHNAQTFDEFILTLRRLTESSQPPAQTYDCNSLTRIRNSDVEANYNAKQLGISDRQTFGDADRPQTCIDFLAKEMHVSCAKKKRSRKTRPLSSSAHSTANETQQHHDFAWGNHHLPLGKSSDIAHQVIWKSMHNVGALAEQFGQLNINTEASGDLTAEMMPESAKTCCRRSLNFDKGAREESSADRENAGDPHGTSDYACCSKTTSQNTTLTPDNAIKMQINLEEKDGGGEEKDVSGKKLDDDGTSRNKVLCDPVIEFAAVTSPFKENHNPDEESIHYIDLNKTPQQKPRRRKIRPKVIREGKPKRSRKPVTPKPVQSKENPIVKRKYVRKKGLNKSPTPTEVSGDLTAEMMPESAKTCRRSLNFDKGAREESSADKENATVYLCREIGLVMQEIDVGLAHDMNTSTGQAAANNFMAFPNEQTPSTSPSKNNPPGAKLNANSVENKNKRKGLATAQDGNISNSQISTIGLQMVGYKRKDTGTIKCADNSSMNLIGARNHGLPSYQSKFRTQFPNSNSKVEDLSSTTKYYSCTSFSKLLEMVSSTKFHEVNSQRSKQTENLRDAYGQSNYTAKKGSAKKQQNTKRSALSSSARSDINEMQQHRNVALGNHHLPLGKSSDIAHEVIWKSTHNVEALGEQVRQLNINTEVRACLT